MPPKNSDSMGFQPKKAGFAEIMALFRIYAPNRLDICFIFCYLTADTFTAYQMPEPLIMQMENLPQCDFEVS